MIFALLVGATAFAWRINHSKYLDAIQRVELVRGWMLAVSLGSAIYYVPTLLT